MNTPKVIASIAVLVLAVFWEVVLLDMVWDVGIIAVVVAPFTTLFVIGIYSLVGGLRTGSPVGGGSSRSAGKVGALGITVLKMTAQGKSQQEIAAATSVSMAVIGVKVEALKRAGLLEGNALSEKGFDAIGESG